MLKGEISACAQVEIRIILFLWMEPHEAVSLGSRIDVQRTTSIFTLFISLFEFLLMSCLLIQNNEVLGFPGGSSGKESACSAEHQGLIPGLGRSLEKEMATHSSTLAWKIPWTEEPGRLYSPWGHKELDTTEQLSHKLMFLIHGTWVYDLAVRIFSCSM